MERAQLIVHPVARRSMVEGTHRFGCSESGRTNPNLMQRIAGKDCNSLNQNVFGPNSALFATSVAAC